MTRKTYQIIFNLLFISAAIYLGVDIFYRVMIGHMNQEVFVSTLASPPSMTVDQPSPREETLTDFQIITKRNLFGSSRIPKGEPSSVDSERRTIEIDSLEPTTLNIELLGTVTERYGDGWAVIEDGDRKKQGLYRVGDAVKNAEIVTILRGKVVLRQGGKDQILEMKSSEGPAEMGPANSPSPGSRAGGEAIAVGRSDITNSLKNINKLLTQVRIQPYLRNRKADGFVLTYISSDSIFSRLGLQRGDIIKRLNGDPIRTPEDAFSFYKTLESGSTLSMDIVRNGKERTIDYEIR